MKLTQFGRGPSAVTLLSAAPPGLLRGKNMFACSFPRAIAFALRMSLVLLFAILLSSQSVFAQQTYVSKYDAYVGYAYFNSPRIGLAENGLHIQVGMNPRTWTSVGFDYSRATGDLALKPDMLLDSLRTALAAQLGALAACRPAIPCRYPPPPSPRPLPPDRSCPSGTGSPSLSSCGLRWA